MTNGAADENYSFDAVGNRTTSHLSTSYGYQSFNRLTSTDIATYEYNDNGSMTNRTDDNGSSQFEWDHENRLRQADTRYGTAHSKYDALGRRVEQLQNGNSTKFVYDGLDVVTDKLPGDSFVKYVNGPGIDNKLSYRQDGSDNYFLADHLGSTVGLTNSSGSATDTNSFDSFGNPTNSAFPSRYQFTGREFDSFSGLQYSRARWYDPNLGRFISEDPIGFGGGDVNLYGYVKSRPLNRRDPMGLVDADQAFYSTLPVGWDRWDVPPNRGRWGPIGAVGDFWGNYNDMRRANTIGADKSFIVWQIVKPQDAGLLVI